MAAAARRKPNCFNLLRQLQLLGQMGRSEVGGFQASL